MTNTVFVHLIRAIGSEIGIDVFDERATAKRSLAKRLLLPWTKSAMLIAVHEQLVIAVLVVAFCCTNVGIAQEPRNLDPRLFVQTGQSRIARWIAASATTPLVAVSDGQSASIWDTSISKEIGIVRNSEYPETGPLAFSPNGRLLAMACHGAATKYFICVFDMTSGEQRSWSTNGAEITSLIFDKEGSQIISGSYEGTLALWNLKGTNLREIDLGSSIMSISLSRDGAFIAVGQFDHSLRLLVRNTLAEKWKRSGHTGAVTALAFNADGSQLFSGSEDYSVRRWNVQSGDEERKSTGHVAAITAIVVSSNGKQLVTTSADQTVKIWGDELFEQSTWRIPGFGLALCADGTSVAVASVDRNRHSGIVIRDIASGEVLHELFGNVSFVSDVAFSPDGSYLLTSSYDARIAIWNLHSGLPQKPFAQHRGSVAALSFIGDTGIVASAAVDGTVILWDVKTEKTVSRWQGNRPISRLAISGDGSALAFGETPALGPEKLPARLMFCQLDEQHKCETPRSLTSITSALKSITLNSDGSILVASNDLGERIVVNTSTGALLPAVQMGRTANVAFAPDGSTLAVSTDRSFTLLNFETGVVKWTQPGSFGPISFSQDGRFVAAAKGVTLQIWAATDGTKIQDLSGHIDVVTSIAFDPSGRFLASGSWDGTAKLWHVESAQGASSEKVPSRLACTLITFQPPLWFESKSAWMAASWDGYFDTNSPDEIPAVWLLPERPYTALPVESYMQDLYKPRLLADIVDERAYARQADAIRRKNHSPPKVHIENVRSDPLDDFTITVAINVEGSAENRTQDMEASGGVYDLRLLINGRMVDYRPRKETGQDQGVSEKGHDGLWKTTTILFNDDQPHTVIFENVKLPQSMWEETLEVSAYAFNRDKVKSETSRVLYTLHSDLSEKKQRPHPHRAYIISVGVSNYDQPGPKNLITPAPDARDLNASFVKALSENLKGRDILWEDIVPLVLVSDDKRDPRSEGLATKSNLRAVLTLLSGRHVDDPKDVSIPGSILKRLKPATEEDLVVLIFSGHGRTNSEGQFFLLPQDAGKEATAENLIGNCAACISSVELASWMKDIFAHETAIILDACESAASVQTEFFRPGPMGDPGLGQLAYDKDILILAAAQPRQDALGMTKLGHGLLTYSILTQGLTEASKNQKTVTIMSLLRDTAERVPELYLRYFPDSRVPQQPSFFNFIEKQPGMPLGADWDFYLSYPPDPVSSTEDKELDDSKLRTQLGSNFAPMRSWNVVNSENISDRQDCSPALSEQGRMVAVSCDEHGGVWLLDTRSGQVKSLTLKDGLDEPERHPAVISPSGKFVARRVSRDSPVCRAQDRKAWIAKAGNGSCIALWNVDSKQGEPFLISGVSLGDLRFVGGNDLLVVEPLFDGDPASIIRPRETINKSTHETLFGPIVISPDGKAVCGRSKRRTVLVKYLATNKALEIPHATTCIAFSLDHAIIATDDRDNYNSVQLWNVDRQHLISSHELSGYDGHSPRILFSSRHDEAVVLDQGGDVRIWNFVLNQFSAPIGSRAANDRLVAITEDGGAFAFTSDDKVVFWSIHPNKYLGSKPIHQVWDMRGSPSGNILIISSLEGDLETFSVATGVKLNCCRAAGRNFSFSPDSSVFGTFLPATGAVTLIHFNQLNSLH
jgi:WD40 repeat protein